MDLKTIHEYSIEIINMLDLKTSPVAVKIVPVGNEIPEGIEQVDKTMRHCQMIDRVRKTKEEFYTLKEDQQCRGGAAAMGLGQLPTKVASGDFYYNVLNHFSNVNAARRTIENAPMLLPNSSKAVVYSALENTSFKPDVVVIICNPRQIMLLTQAAMYKSGGRLNVGFAGKQSVCSDGVVQAYRDGEIGITVGCSGSRAYTEIGDEEMTIGIPAELLGEIFRGLKTICS